MSVRRHTRSVAVDEELLQEEDLTVVDRRARGEPDAFVPELLVEAGSLERVAIDSHDDAVTLYRFGLDGAHKLCAEPVSSTIVAHPKPLDLT
jgi:hypothetical protein